MSSLANADAVAPVRVAAKLRRELAREAAVRDRDRRFPHAELRRLKTSGLLHLTVPERFGGSGADLGVLVRVIAELAEGDPNVAQMYLVHTSSLEVVATSRLAARTKREIFRRIVEDGNLFTNAYSEVGTKTIEDFRARFTRGPDGRWRFNARKYYCTGSLGGDLVLIGGPTGDADATFTIAVLDIRTPGIVVHDDWRGMGQRTTASGTIEFDDVLVPTAWLFQVPYYTTKSLTGSHAQLMFSAIFLGIARAALHDAAVYVRERARPWIHSGVEAAAQDPYVLMRFGEMKILVDSAEAVLERAVGSWLQAQARLSQKSRDAASVATAEAKYVTGTASLRVSELLFQVCGSGSVGEKHDFDRHWRNARTLTLHDPMDYKLRLIGDYVLNGASPPVSGNT